MSDTTHIEASKHSRSMLTNDLTKIRITIGSPELTALRLERNGATVTTWLNADEFDQLIGALAELRMARALK